MFCTIQVSIEEYEMYGDEDPEELLDWEEDDFIRPKRSREEVPRAGGSGGRSVDERALDEYFAAVYSQEAENYRRVTTTGTTGLATESAYYAHEPRGRRSVPKKKCARRSDSGASRRPRKRRRDGSDGRQYGKSEGRVKSEKVKSENAKPNDDENENENDGRREAIEEEADEITYAPYRPSKLGYGMAHPDPVVENATLAAVEPPDITYNLALPADIISEGKLSDLQVRLFRFRLGSSLLTSDRHFAIPPPSRPNHSSRRSCTAASATRSTFPSRRIPSGRRNEERKTRKGSRAERPECPSAPASSWGTAPEWARDGPLRVSASRT